MFPAVRPTLILPLVVSGALVFLLNWTQEYDPPGSPLGWLLIAVMLWAHWPLAAPENKPVEKAPDPAKPAMGWPLLLTAGLLSFLAAFSAWSYGQAIYTQLFAPKDGAQLGLIAQALGRWETFPHIYDDSYLRDEYHQVNSFFPGNLLAYWLVRELGFEWRYGTLISLAGVFSLLAGAAAALWRTGYSPAQGPLLGGMAGLLLAMLWVLSGSHFGTLFWVHTPPVWLMSALFGVACAARWHLIEALALGALAAANPGWLLLAPAGGALMLRLGARPLHLLPILLVPIAAFGMIRQESEVFWEYVFGEVFRAGAAQAEEMTAWRYASFHAWGDIAGLRPGIYLLGFGTILFSAAAIFRAQTEEKAIHLFAFMAFLALACAPRVYLFHWMGHAILLAALLPAAYLASESADEQMPTRRLSFGWQGTSAGAGCLALSLLAGFLPLYRGVDSALSGENADRWQPANENIALGFHYVGEDWGWGAGRSMTTGFFLDEVRAGMLRVRIGTLGGPFTAYNPFVIRVNGVETYRYFIIPGDYKEVSALIPERFVHVGFNTVEIEPEWARTPISLGAGEDERELSLNYGGLQFVPLTPLNP